jgi:serine/threonine protein phosphatase PrpC
MTPEPSWQVIGQSVRGASHVRADLPNQDAITWRPSSRGGPPLILVVSDGHGSAKSFRSDRGSKFAVTATADLLQELVCGLPDAQNLSMVKRFAVERIPDELVRRWRNAVDRDLAEHPFTELELAELTQQRGERSCTEVAKAPRLAYGATVLGVLVTQGFLLFLQLGDGDILIVADDGTVTRPLARDARLIANETTSLCMSEAWREVRLRFQANYGGLPALIMAATDGYANSFVNDDAFRKVGSDILTIMREDSVQAVEENLLEWLDEASASGSGDDISLGILYRADAVRAQSGSAPSSEDAGGFPDVASSTSPVNPAETHSLSEGSRSLDTQLVSGGVRHRATEDSEIGSSFVARFKHEGPREPSKRVRLEDAIGGGDADADDASVDVAPRD